MPQPVSNGRILILGAILGAFSLFLRWLIEGRLETGTEPPSVPPPQDGPDGSTIRT